MSSAPLSPQPSAEAASSAPSLVQPNSAEPIQETELAQAQTSQATSNQSVLQVFVSTFVTIFLAELGDKTQVTTLLMSAESHKPWVVFAGAGSALVATSLLGVLLGRWLAQRLAPKTLETSAGITLILIAAWLSWDVFKNF